MSVKKNKANKEKKADLPSSQILLPSLQNPPPRRQPLRPLRRPNLLPPLRIIPHPRKPLPPRNLRPRPPPPPPPPTLLIIIRALGLLLLHPSRRPLPLRPLPQENNLPRPTTLVLPLRRMGLPVRKARKSALRIHRRRRCQQQQQCWRGRGRHLDGRGAGAARRPAGQVLARARGGICGRRPQRLRRGDSAL